MVTEGLYTYYFYAPPPPPPHPTFEEGGHSAFHIS